jgi:hypothetical protein
MMRHKAAPAKIRSDRDELGWETRPKRSGNRIQAKRDRDEGKNLFTGAGAFGVCWLAWEPVPVTSLNQLTAAGVTRSFRAFSVP